MTTALWTVCAVVGDILQCQLHSCLTTRRPSAFCSLQSLCFLFSEPSSTVNGPVGWLDKGGHGTPRQAGRTTCSSRWGTHQVLSNRWQDPRYLHSWKTPPGADLLAVSSQRLSSLIIVVSRLKVERVRWAPVSQVGTTSKAERLKSAPCNGQLLPCCTTCEFQHRLCLLKSSNSRYPKTTLWIDRHIGRKSLAVGWCQRTQGLLCLNLWATLCASLLGAHSSASQSFVLLAQVLPRPCRCTASIAGYITVRNTFFRVEQHWVRGGGVDKFRLRLYSLEKKNPNFLCVGMLLLHDLVFLPSHIFSLHLLIHNLRNSSTFLRDLIS